MPPDAAAAAFPSSHGRSRSQSPPKAQEVPAEVAKDLNQATGLKFSRGTWGVIWSVIVGTAGWLTSMKMDSMNLTADLRSIGNDVKLITGQVQKLDGKVERMGNRLTKVEINQALRGRKVNHDDDQDAESDETNQ